MFKKFRQPFVLVSILFSVAVLVGANYVLVDRLISQAPLRIPNFFGKAATPTYPTLVEYINQPGGQELVVPCGTTLKGGKTSISHADWLIIRAQSPGCVTVDLSSTGFELHDADFKVVLAGFKFVNGLTEIKRSSNVIFWYSDFSFPPDEWFRQYSARGGVMPVTAANCDAMTKIRNSHPNFLPSGIRTDNYLESNPTAKNSHIGIYGTDIHDVGDDGIMFYAMDDFKIQGTKIWNASSSKNGRNYDDVSGCSPYGGDWMHNDSIQTSGGVNEVRMSDSWFAQTVQWAAEGGHTTNSSFQNMWFAGGPDTGSVLSVHSGGQIRNNFFDRIRGFGNGNAHLYNGKVDSGWATWRTDFKPCPTPQDTKKSCQAIWPNNWNGPGFEAPVTNLDLTSPPGVTYDQWGRITDINQIKDHPENPANKWRQANPFESYRSVLNLNPGPTPNITGFPTIPPTATPTPRTSVDPSGNLAAGKTFTASSAQNGSPVSYANDANSSTRWISANQDNQTLSTDLGVNHNINKVSITDGEIS